MNINRYAPQNKVVSTDDLFHPIGSLDRRGFLRSCCLASLALLANGCGSNQQQGTAASQPGTNQPGVTLRVGHLPAGCVSHLLLANKRGMFKKAGLSVEVTQFNSPGDNLQALVAGAQDVIHNPWTNTIHAFSQGIDNLRIICGSGKGGIELVARKGSVKTRSELAAATDKSLRVGTLKLDTLEVVTFGTMKKSGVNYSDYKMTFFPSMVGMGEALLQGSVDVCSLAQPYAQSVVAEAGGTYLESSNQVWGPDAADCVISTTADYIKKEPTLLADYLSVLRQAAKALNDNYQAAVEELVPVYNSTASVLKVALKRQVPQPIMDQVALQSIRKGVSYLVDMGYLKPEQKNISDNVFDNSIQEKSLKAA